MSILVDENTKVLIQGITGSFGGRHAQLSLDYGTQVVAGVTPGKGGQTFSDTVPIYDTVDEAVAETGATVSAIFVPPPFAGDAILEAVDAGVDLVVAITEGIPVMDMMRVRAAMEGSNTRLIGPNCPGIVTPGTGEDSHGGCRIGIAPGYIHKKGSVGVVSRSGTLTYEAVWQVGSVGLGPEHLCRNRRRPDQRNISHRRAENVSTKTPKPKSIIMIGEIGGTAEEEAAAWAAENCDKPIAAFIAGATAPPGRRMGHAGAIISGGKGTAAAKKEALREAGIEVAETPAEMGAALLRAMG